MYCSLCPVQTYIPTYYRDLLVIETAATMNAGFCDYWVRHCPPSQQLLDECRKVGGSWRAREGRRQALGGVVRVWWKVW